MIEKINKYISKNLLQIFTDQSPENFVKGITSQINSRNFL